MLPITTLTGLVSAPSRGMNGLRMRLADITDVLRDTGDRRTGRRVWARAGRAHVEVRGLTGHGEGHERLVQELEGALRRLAGVNWAGVNAALGQVLVDFDEDRLGPDDVLEVVERVEEAHGTDADTFPAGRPQPPFASAPATLAAAALAADCLGLMTATIRRVAMRPALSPALRIPTVLAELQPRVRGLLESRLGRAQADTLIGVSNAVVHALTRGEAPLALDALQRVLQLAEIRGRQVVWQRREPELVADGEGLPAHSHPPTRRPRPLPSGPVETCVDRTSLASLSGVGGLLAWTRDLEQSAKALLATVPKAAAMGREAFAARLGDVLARDGVVPMDGTALRLLDRVSAVLIDARVLCTGRPRLLAVTTVGDLGEAEAWSAAQSVLDRRTLRELSGEGPWTRGPWRLERPPGLPAALPASAPALTADLHGEDGRRQARIRIGCELDPLADALVAAARSGARRLVLTSHASTDEIAPWADELLPLGASLPDTVRRLQIEDHGVLVISGEDDEALGAADLGVAITARGAGRVCWSADLLCGPGLLHAWRVLRALEDARSVSRRSARLSMGGSALGALIAAAGTRPAVAGLATSPVYSAAFLAMLGGIGAARRVERRPAPAPRVRGNWHALGARETLSVLSAFRENGTELPDGSGASRGAGPGAPGAARTSGALWAAGTVVRAGAPGAAASASARFAALTRNTVSLVHAVREELHDPLTPVLALGAAASAAVGSGVDSFLVVSVMAGNAVISGAQRLRAERSLRGLLLSERMNGRLVDWAPAMSLADGVTADREVFFAGLTTAPVHTVAAEELRVGDIVALRPSDVVPADARLLVSDRLELDEAGLTGESGPVAKDPAATPGADLADRSCMLYQGCTVLAGTGYAVVVAAGAQTEAGRAAELAGRATAPIGIEGRLAALTKVALPATGLGGAAVTLLGLLHGVPVREALSTGVAIAVAAVPEGLPLVATVAQSAAARRLSHRGVLTRSARVLEALGRVDVVCFDKTGTLTEGRLAVARVAGYDQELPARGALGKRLLRTAARACPEPDGGRALAHATDQAVIDAAAAHCDGDGTWRPVSELPFEASRGFSACLGTWSGRPHLAVKGAPEIVLARCAYALSPGAADDTVPLTPERRRATERLLYSLASDGLRVLAVAETRPAASDTPTAEVAEIARDLTLLGFIAIADTTRPGAAETVKRLTDAGVRVTMVTGDHPTTAVAIARELGIPDAEPVLTGAELDTLPEGERVERIARTTVFARVSPEHKVRIVQALRQAGQVVAMTGDGVNDAAAIRLADIGIGLSAHGSASARAAADLVLTDSDPTRILDALREGRALWRSVRDAVAILVGGNAGEVAFTLLGAAVAGRAPLGTRQLLLVNLLTDMLPALAVALARAREHKSGEDPLVGGPSSALFGSDLGRILAVRGSATALGAAAAWQCGRMTGRPRRASTMGLAALVGTQLGQTYLTDWHSPLVLITSVASAATLFAIVETPVVSHFFGCTPLGPMAWSIVGGCSAAATVGAAVAPRLLFPRRVPLAV
ncbi:cation-translocating P-type ATPase [Streptomyces rugosispiralis]|uniref:HAD-IC family P-type ATPase n=1 Tax=Streptomyces rugosispiralis TaxID=2967341 RepID=A0ABT1UV96_9ACTN|nr:cation-translocating P-type ATPase [Streptomyces rugosispiralis]MCQ8188534.1 HAD-IC family P-type ATPase [Streptomyces rugosispiralis]